MLLKRTWWGVGLAAIGVLFVVIATTLALVVAPSRKQLPADVDESRQLSGTAKILIDPVALALGNMNSAVRRDVPVTGEQTVAVLNTEGEAALVSDVHTLSVAGTPVSTTQGNYAVDRTSLEATADHPESWEVTPHQGLTVG